MKPLALILLLCSPVKAALPDVITDPSTRDAMEYLDAKLTQIITSTSGFYGAAIGLAGLKVGSQGDTGNATVGANNLSCYRYYNTIKSYVTTMGTALHGAADGVHMRMAIYSDSSGLPGSLMSGTSEYTTSSSAGLEIFLTLTTPQTLVANTNYWLCVHPSAGLDFPSWTTNSNTYGKRARYKTSTYSSGFPSTFGTPTGTDAFMLGVGAW